MNAQLAEPLVVRALDALGEGVADVEITFAEVSGGGTLTPTRVRTDVTGRATAQWQLGTTAGSQSARASFGSSHSVEFTATAEPGPAASVALDPAMVGFSAVGDTQRVSAAVRDAYGNATAGVLVWSTTDAGVATVEDGLVRAVSAGTATIAAAVGPARGEAQVAVVQEANVLAVTPQTVSFTALGESAVLGAVILDRNGNPLSGVDPEWVSRDASIATVDAAGRVEARQRGETYVVATQGAARDSTHVSVAQAAAGVQAVAGGGGSEPAGGSRTLRVRVVDAGGSGIEGVAVQWSAQSGTVPASSVTDAAGEAEAAWAVGTAPGVRQATAGVASLTPVNFTVTVVPAEASAETSTMAVADDALTANGTSATIVTVRLRDAFGNAHVTGGASVTITTTAGVLSAGGSAGASVAAVDAGDGTYHATLTAATTAGQATVAAAVAGAALPAPVTVTFLPGAAAAVRVTAGDGLTAPAGSATAEPPTVEVVDAQDNVVPGVTVTFAVTEGGGSIGGATSAQAVSNAAGIAVAPAWTVGTVAGVVQRITASAAGASSAVFTAQVTHAAAAALSLEVQPAASAQAGFAFGAQPVVRVRDVYGNTVPAQGIEVAAALAGTGTLLGTAFATTDGDGIASFTDLAIGAAAGPHVLLFSASGVAAAASDTIQLGPGTAVRLGFVSGGGWIAGVGTDRLVEAGIYDAWDNPVPGYPIEWELGDPAFGSLSNGTDSGSLVTSLTGVDGVARAWWTMPLQIHTVVEAFASAYDGDGAILPGAPRRYDAVVVAAEPTHLAFATEPSTVAQNGVPLAQQPVIELRDQYGNPSFALINWQVSVEIASGDGTLQGTTVLNTAEDGRATFTDLAIVGPPGEYTLRFISAGLTSVTSATIVLE